MCPISQPITQAHLIQNKVWAEAFVISGSKHVGMTKDLCLLMSDIEIITYKSLIQEVQLASNSIFRLVNLNLAPQQKVRNNYIVAQ